MNAKLAAMRAAPTSWVASHPANTRAQSGDFVECVDLGQRQAVIVGEVQGRSVSASHGADALRAYVRNLMTHRVPLITGLWLASEFFARSIVSDSVASATLCIALADHREGSIEYASLGHEPAVLFDGTGGHEFLEPTGTALGPASMQTFSECVVPLRPNNLLVVVTDGITRARPPNGDDATIFGHQGVVAAVQSALQLGTDPAQAISDAARQQAGGRFADDATAVVSSLSTPQRKPSRVRPPRRATVGELSAVAFLPAV